MKNFFKLLIYSIILIGLIFSVKQNLVSYQSYTKTYNKISAKEILENNNSEKQLIYVGRETCPNCRKFVPKLTRANSNIGVTINYIDSDKYRNQDDFKTMKHNLKIKYVPYVAIIQNNKIISTLNISDEITVTEIQEFLKQSN
ncbi:conjugal transfer protein TraF [Streptococcus hyovaginalis]|uniref:conjugal transfer protein TraF n=1 Tax=Streptococcus hyovaginalis TaxID=149015 RepID=UPI003BF926AF